MTDKKRPQLSIVIPAKNEADALGPLLSSLRDKLPSAEIIVVNDGSTDETEAVCIKSNVVVKTHNYSMGNGAAIKSGARKARGDFILFMDGDGQHTAEDALRLFEYIQENDIDLLIGARSRSAQASIFRLAANSFYNWFATKLTGKQIVDLTSGMRIAKRSHFLKFLYLLPNGFSYPTTSTMAFIRSGFSIDFLPINVKQRVGKSHISLFKDGFRFFLIIIKIGTLYSPLKIFLPISLAFFLTGLGYYLYTYIEFARFTNMSALLFSTATITFLIGLVSEQITSLMYKDED